MADTIDIFFAYARADESLRNVLEKHLSVLRRQGFITSWHDQKVLPGQEREQEAMLHLRTAHIILLLVSPDFLASDYTYGVAFQQAMERHQRGEATIIPIIVRPVDWKHDPLDKLQPLPLDERPVTSWPNQDEGFRSVAEGIREVVEKIRETSIRSSTIQDKGLQEEKHQTIVVETRADPNEGKSGMSGAPLRFPHTSHVRKAVLLRALSQTPPQGILRRVKVILLFILALLIIGSTVIVHNIINGTPAHVQAPPTPNTVMASNEVMFGFDAAHTHFNPYEQILTPTNVSRLKHAWTSSKVGIADSPVVANGVLYIGSDNWNLYALNARTGSLLWNAVAGDHIRSSPAVANGMVYVGSDDHKLYAFKAEGCGQPICLPLWTATTGDAIESSPTVANGMVYVGSDDHKLYAFKAEGCGQSTCLPVWTATTGGAIESSPAVANGMVYVGSHDWSLYAFKAEGCGQSTCLPVWDLRTFSDINSSPTVVNGIVYVGSDDWNFLAVDARTGNLLWSFQTGGSVFSSPAVANGRVYVGSNDGSLYAFKAEGCGQSTCSPVWRFHTGNFVESSPLLANKVVYISSEDGNLYALNTSTGSMRWRFHTGGPIDSSPAVVNGMVYVNSYDGKLYAFDLTSTE